MKNTKTKKLVTCAILIALATVLSLFTLGIKMPLGGSLTLLSMVPICLISIMFGLNWGFASAFVYSVIQLLIDLPAALGWGMDGKTWIGMIIFDYLVAFTVLGIAGKFRKKGSLGAMLGGVLALVLRYVSHIISGTIFFAMWMPEEWSSPLIYSICYNGAFMLPEIILTAIGLYFIVKVPEIQKLYVTND